jgi:hypothetical protein
LRLRDANELLAASFGFNKSLLIELWTLCSK